MQNLEELDETDAPAGRQEYKLVFTGSAGEYFKIWLSNICLTIVSLGIYGPWAKVRREKYFYNHTLLDGSSFDYTANPVSILKGRAIALLAIVLITGLSGINPILEVFVVLSLFIISPWVINQSLRFKARYTVYRNISLSFSGTYWQTVYNWMVLKFLSLFTFGISFPWAKFRERKYVLKNLRFGTTPFELRPAVGAFYKVYIRPLLFLPVGGVLYFISEEAAAAYVVVTIMLLFTPLITAGIAKATWNNASLGEFEIRYPLPISQYVWVAVSNLVFRMLTFGLATAYCAVRMYKFKLNYLSLEGEGSLEQFVGARQADTRAYGEEIADAFDIDIDIGF